MFRKLLFITLLASVFSISARAQKTVTLHFNPLDTTVDVGSSVNLKLEQTGMSTISAVQLKFQWDPNVLTFVDPLQNMDPEFAGFSKNITDSTYSLVWIDLSNPPANHAFGPLLFEIPFTVDSVGTSQVYFTQAIMGEQDNSVTYTVLTDTATINGVTPGAAAPLVLQAGSASVDMNGDTCIDVQVVSGFTDITTLNFSLGWDNIIAQYQSVTNMNTTLGLAAANFVTSQTTSGQLGFTYSGAGADLSAGDVLFSACYTGIGAEGSSTAISFGETPTATVVENSSGAIANTFNNGALSINTSGGGGPTTDTVLHLMIPDTLTTVGANVCVPITVRNFNLMDVASFSISWDTSIIKLSSMTSADNPNNPGNMLGAFNTNDTTGGHLGYAYFEFSQGVYATLPDYTTLVEACFDVVGAVGDYSPLVFTDSPVSVTAQDSSHFETSTFMTVDTSAGSVSIPAVTLDTFHLFAAQSDCTQGVMPGDTIAVDFLVDNLVNMTGFQARFPVDTNKLEFLSALTQEYIPHDFFNLVNFSGTNLTLLWTAPNATPYTWAPDSTKIVTIYFAAKTSSSAGDVVDFIFDDSFTSAGGPNGDVPAVAHDMPLHIVAPLALNATVTNLSCDATDDGAISLAPTGWTGGYTYEWTGPGGPYSGSSLTGLHAGTYNVTVTSCNQSVTDSFVLEEHAGFAVSVTNLVNEAFPPGNNGTATVAGSGAGPYNYNWTGPGGPYSGATISNLAEGTYLAIVDDGAGCTTSLAVGIARLTVSGTSENVTCNGASNGSITLSVSGGSAPYSYQWSAGPGGSAPTGLAAGDYTVTVSDATTANVVLNFTLTEPTPINIQLDGTVSTQSGMNNGAVNISVSGGTPNGSAPYYSFAWSNGATTEDLSGVGVDSYTVTVTDANGCTQVGGPYTVSAFGTPNPTVVVDSVDCNGQSNGSITITSIASGTAPYTVTMNGANNQTTDGTSAVVYNGLAAGDYTMHVTDANTEDTTFVLHVGEPGVLTIIDQNITPSSGVNGVITFNMQGGTPSYQYDWDHNAYDGIEDIYGLQAEDYTVTVTDAHGCTVSQTFTVPSASVPVPSVAVSDATCNGESTGVITITSIAGANPNFTITGLNPSQTTDGTNAVTYSGLAAGAYSLTVTDNIGVDTSFTITVGEPSPITFNIINVTNEVVPPGSNGSIDMDVSGGTPNASAPFYSYQWTGGYNTEDIAGLTQGTYTLTVVDAAGCVKTSTPIAVGQDMASFGCSTDVTDTDCPNSENGKIILTVAGGALPISYQWYKNGLPVATTKNLTDIGAGFYSVTVTDANGATTSCSGTVSQESFLIGSINVLSDYNGYNVSGFGKTDGRAQAVPENGAVPYQYKWSNNELTQIATSLPGGQSTVTITDNLGCEVIVSENLTEPDALTCATTVTNTPCVGSSDGAIDLAVSGGATDYNYSWTGPSFSSGAQNISGLAEGVYLVTVTDANGNTTACSGTVAASSDISLSFEDLSDYNGYNVSCSTCSDGSVNLVASGGQAPYHYAWSNGDARQQPDTLRAGVVSVTVTDDLGCTKEGTVTMTAPGVFTCSVVTTNTVCPGSSDGSAAVVLSGGVAPMAGYFWTGPGNPPQDSLIEQLSQGTYDVTVTDANGVTTSCSGVVEQLSHLTISVNLTAPPTSPTSSDAKAKVIANGGAEPYSYEWSDGETTANATQLPCGVTSVTVTDNLGCVATLNFVIVCPGELYATIATKDASCYGVCDGEASVTSVEGGTAPYSYAWSTSQAGVKVTDMCAGVFTVTITDFNNLTKVITDTIGQPDSLSISFAITNPSAFGKCDGSAVATVSGGTPDYKYIWNDGGNGLPPTTSATIKDKCVDEYLLVVTDANNCTAMKRVRFTAPPTDDCFNAPKILTPGVLDGSNDKFIITCLDPIARNDLSVYSRWGQLVFSQKNYDGTWTGIDNGGKSLPEGAYYWVLTYTENGKEFTKKGHVTIVR